MSPARTWRDWSCTVRVLVDADERTADAGERIVRDLMASVERAASRFRPDSELEVVSDAAPRLLPVGPTAQRLVAVALDAARRTDGAVDPTVGGPLQALGYDADIATVRSRSPRAARATDPTGAAADWTKVVLDTDLGRVGLPRGLRLDLGATAKAWTADEAARRIAAAHRCPALVEIGGDIAVAGAARRPWLVRVAEVEGGPGEVVGLTHGGLATSSAVARRWDTPHGPAHHVVDPATGRPTSGPVRTATVWSASAVEANTFSTAALVWGSRAEARLRLAGASARLVRTDDTVRTVGDWPTEEVAA
ncbi:FAD:protein FMN transferase [Nocardioides mangrovi]|uniref:FAD:protein FMN transferase n=1 Tax=Nocardioides mangrovi TaxID=2874580 RepID=A0ABS7UA73_9ACTN|nr:FAD:protein FMN transferase [Nocardioides mangrovi]MBZ5737888.1 FAD:protein FMN transferase [Nocardioides mangrovi]